METTELVIENEREIKRGEQTKFVLDLRSDKKERDKILKILEEANNKDYGREVTIKDLVLLLFTKLTPKDIEKLKEGSVTEMEKVFRMLKDYNQKNGTNLRLSEFLVMKLS
ncbi:MAG: hypothetical protein ACOYL6_02545 [Bacteriovoracaceae bacterium]